MGRVENLSPVPTGLSTLPSSVPAHTGLTLLRVAISCSCPCPSPPNEWQVNYIRLNDTHPFHKAWESLRNSLRSSCGR